ncbi:hypothetical protein [Chitinophaga rhizophila]|uniref:Uncharacterized protein n=1 Tax=Chitinophaga rhizophila TaxID=2866212 RepID=A0ABS7GCQ1_9BACT|nr:hypothetical protein [Chitinophaga rhizophila]MBW8685449.1 hypothetical protein [Chitinophaga rhizophila]
MRYLFAIIILFGLLLQNFSQLVIMVKYKMDEAYIASVLCENRAMPEMHCNGKCYLKKQLKKDEQQQQNGSTGKEKYEVSYINVLQEFSFEPVAPSISLLVHYQDPELHTPLISIFHPPQA